MFISIQDLELRKVEFAETFAPGVIVFGPDSMQQEVLQVRGHAELIEEDHGGKKVIQDIRMLGDFSTRIELSCSRCLEPVVADLKGKFDLLYRPLGVDQRKSGEEIEITADDVEIGYYRGNGLLLEDVLKEQVLLQLPLKPLCREDCKGLCPKCGANRNAAVCGCSTDITDARWAALAGIKDKLKQ